MFLRSRRFLLTLGAAVVVYGLAGFLLAPRLIRSILLDRLGETLTTTPTLQAVRVNPFALSVTLRQFSIPEPGGKQGSAPAVAFDELHLRATLLSPFFRAWTLDELRLVKPSVNAAILEDRSLSLFRLLRQQPTAGDSGSGEPPPVLIRKLQIVDGSLAFEDRSRKQPLRKSLIPIQIELRDFSTRKDRENGYSFLARTDRQEELAWRGSFTMRPFTSEGDLRVGNLQALTIEDFLGPENPYQFTKGTIDFAAKYRVDATRVPAKAGLHDMGVTVRDFVMVDRATGENAIAATTVETRGGAVDASTLQADLGHVTASGARLRLWMDMTGKTNLQRWSRPPADSTAPSWVTRISRLEANGAELVYEDRRIEPPPTIRVHGAHVEMTDYSTKAGTVSPLSAACSLGTSGWTEAKGTFTSGTAATDLQVAMRDVDLRDLEGYITPFARVDITKGTVSALGRFRWNAVGPRGPMMRFTGDASSARFASLDGRHKRELLSWDRLEIKGLEYDYAPSRVRIREIATVKPYIRFIIAPDLTTNIQGLAIPPDSLPVAFRPTSAPKDTMPVEIDLVRVKDGSMYFADLSLEPNFGTGIVGMNGTIRELSSAQAAHAAMDLSGKVDEFSPVTMGGTINPLNSRGLTDVGVKFENIELTTFTPYSGKFMGYRINRGKLDLDLHYAIQDRQLKGENKILIRQLTLGEKVDSKDATSLPVKFAIALLKDKNGDIDLDLPVSGSLDDPKFSVWKVVWKILGQLVVKAVTSPFKLFGAIFGGDDQEVAPAIAFPYGSVELDTTEVKKLDAILKGLNDRPNLKLEVEQTVHTSRDSMAVLNRRYVALIQDVPVDARSKSPDPATVAAAAIKAPSGMGATDYALRLTRAYTTRFGKPPEMAKPKTKQPKGALPDGAVVAAEVERIAYMEDRVRATIQISSDEIGMLATERARRVQGYLLRDSTIVPDRIYIVGSKGSYAPDSLGVRVGLTLTD